MAVSLSALRDGRLIPQGRFLVLISVKGWVDPRSTVRLAGLGHLKNPMTSSGIEPATFRHLLDVSVTITLDCNSSHIERLLDNDSLTVFLPDLELVSSLLVLSTTEWISRFHECTALHNLGRTEQTPLRRTVRLLISCPVVAETPGYPKIPRIQGNLCWILVDMWMRFREPWHSKRSYS
jgi:hypothetical protein